MKGLMGIPTGIAQLDDLTNGWLGRGAGSNNRAY